MKHSSRRILALLLALSLCIGMMPMSIFAEPETEAINEQSEEKIELSQSETDDSADLEEESEGVDVFETDAKGAPEAAKKADVTVLEEKKVDLEKVEEDAPLEAVKKAEMPVEALVKAVPAEEDRSMVIIASDAAMDALTTEADTKSEKASTTGTIHVYFYLDYKDFGAFTMYSNKYASANCQEGTTLASIAPDISDKKDGYVFMYWCHANYNGKDPIKMDEPLSLDKTSNGDIYAGGVWGHIVEYVIDGEKIDYNYSDGRTHIMRDGFQIVKDEASTSQPNIKKEGYVSEWPASVPVIEDRTIANGNPVEGWWVKVWTVSFVDEDGEPIDKPQTVKDGQFATKPTTAPAKNGYIFDGWYLATDNEESVNYFEADEDTKAVKSDITLVAHWTEKTKYTVSFYDENGVKIEKADQIVYDGDFAEPYDYESEDYEGQLLVWNVKDADGNLTEYDFNTPITGDIALYASWEDVFTVLYHVTNPANSFPLADVFDITYPCADAAKITLPTLADISTRILGYQKPDGFNFIGWATSPDGPVLKANADGTYDLAALLEANDPAAINDAAKSAVQSAPRQRITVSDNPGQESNGEERPNWPGTIIPGDPIPFTPISGDLNLYSVWEEVFTINYHTNYPTDRKDGKPDDSTVPTDPYAGLAEDAVKPEQFVLKSLDDADLKFETPEGYEFEGWYIVYSTGSNPRNPRDPGTVIPERPSIDVEYSDNQISLEGRDNSSNQGKQKITEDEMSQNEQGGQQVVNDTPAVQSGTSDRLYQPDESYNIYRKVDVYAIWLKKPVVMYHTFYAQFPDDMDLGGLEDDDYLDPTPYSVKDAKGGKQIEVLTFEDTGFVAPNGYVFDHWLVKFDDPNPRAESPVMPDFDDEDEADNEVKAAKQEAVLVDVKEAKTEKKETLVKMAAKASDVATAQKVDPAANKEPITLDINRYPGETQELHFRVDFNAIYVPAHWVQYNSNYPEELELDVQLANDNIAKDKNDVIYKVLSLDEVTKKNAAFKAPVGYKFLGWSLDDPDQTEKLLNAPDDTITFPGEKPAPTDVKPTNGNTVIDKDPGSVVPIDLSQIPNKDNGQNAPSSGLVSAGGASEETKATVADKATDEKVPGATVSDQPPEQDKDPGMQDETYMNNPEHVFYAQWEKVYGVYWIDENGSTDDPLATGTYDTFDPDNFDPAAEYGKQDGPNTDTLTKTENGVTYVFDHWNLKEFNEEEQTAVYEAVYRPVENQTNPGRPNNPSNPTTNTPAEDVSEIENNETPLTGYEESAEEVNNNETPLAGFEGEPEEETEVAEEAIPLTPFTGDDRNTVVWGIVSILSLLGIVLVARRRKEE